MISEVYNTDCMEFMRTLPDNFFDLAIADPPYAGANDPTINGGGRFGQRFDRYKKFTSVDWDVAPKQEFFDELYRVSKNQIIWGANYFEMPPTRCFLVWKKLTISEKFSMAMAEYAWTSFNGNAKVFECAPQGKVGDRFHPTQKPVELYAWILRNFAKEGDKIFDPMAGSQSSRIAAYKMGFDYWGCELNESYFNMGNERFERECKGITRLPDGTTVRQLSLFDNGD